MYVAKLVACKLQCISWLDDDIDRVCLGPVSLIRMIGRTRHWATTWMIVNLWATTVDRWTTLVISCTLNSSVPTDMPTTMATAIGRQVRTLSVGYESPAEDLVCVWDAALWAVLLTWKSISTECDLRVFPRFDSSRLHGGKFFPAVNYVRTGNVEGIQCRELVIGAVRDSECGRYSRLRITVIVLHVWVTVSKAVECGETEGI